MSTIGTFTKSENGYTCTVRTLNVNVKVKFVPNDKTSSKGPDYRVLARSEEHTSELQSLMRISYAVFCLKNKKKYINNNNTNYQDYLIILLYIFYVNLHI